MLLHVHLVLECVEILLPHGLLQTGIAVRLGAVNLQPEAVQLTAVFPDVESRARLEVGAVGQLKLDQLRTKGHQREVQVIHGGDPVDREVGDLPEAGEGEEGVWPRHAQVDLGDVGAQLLQEKELNCLHINQELPEGPQCTLGCTGRVLDRCTPSALG